MYFSISNSIIIIGGKVMEFFWLTVILFLSFVEIITINLVTIWFVASALVSLLLSFFDISFYIQFGVFVILGIILLITTRKPLEKMLQKNKQKTNLDRVVDMEGIVTEKISKNNNISLPFHAYLNIYKIECPIIKAVSPNIRP